MTRRFFVLDTDGTSDRALVRIVVRLLEECAPALIFDLEWVDWTRTPARTLQVADRLERTLKLYPRADAVFLHRDAEHEPLSARTREVTVGVDELRRRRANATLPSTVAVVPVRMHEAWLLVSERAIRQAVGRPNGVAPLGLPPVDRLESIPDAKDVLYRALELASEARGRSLKRFRPRQHAWLVSQYIEDLAPLRQLSAFRWLEERTRELVAQFAEK